MKQFIVLLAALQFLLLFLLQFSLEQQNSSRLSLLQTHVAAAKEIARQEGCFTQENITRLKTQIATDFELDVDDILVNVTTSPRYRVNLFDERELIDYQIIVPIRRIMAGNRFLGISDEENQSTILIQGSVASERLLP